MGYIRSPKPSNGPEKKGTHRKYEREQHRLLMASNAQTPKLNCSKHSESGIACHHDRTVEYFTPMANTCPRGDSHHQLKGMFKKHVLAEAGSPSSKAAAISTRGAYMKYVSTAKWRERRWRLFSTFP